MRMRLWRLACRMYIARRHDAIWLPFCAWVTVLAFVRFVCVWLRLNRVSDRCSQAIRQSIRNYFRRRGEPNWNVPDEAFGLPPASRDDEESDRRKRP